MATFGTPSVRHRSRTLLTAWLGARTMIRRRSGSTRLAASSRQRELLREEWRQCSEKLVQECEGYDVTIEGIGPDGTQSIVTLRMRPGLPSPDDG